jgi:glutamate N-acetyltransferase / amino-acid N-acetyltransferase
VAVSARWPDGIQSSGTAAGIKGEGALDLGVIVADRPVAWAGTFTKNAAAAASVTWCRARLGKPVRAVVVNSGNANACTGRAGEAAVAAIARETAASVGCQVDDVLVASTGPIGVRLPVDALVAGLPAALQALGSGVDDFARSIMTTDTHTKVAEREAGGARIVGVAKGAAMLAPNMATMLAFIATDAALPPPALQRALDRAVSGSFDRISVDACESTNDSVVLLATGDVAVSSEETWSAALDAVCADLAEQMVRDAEGGTKLVRIRVEGATDEAAAVALGRAVAASVLWRSAVHGGDPNWGRIVSALGAADRSLDLETLSVSIGSAPVFDAGAPAASLEEAAKEMTGDEIELACIVGSGSGAAEILTADISPDYVTLNAYGTS